MYLYIIRHGKTYWNEAGKIQGSTDIELNEEGISVAKETAIGLKDIEFKAIYSSPLKRAKVTAEILKHDRDLEVIIDDRIKELSFGVLEGRSVSYMGNAKADLSQEDDLNFANFFTQPHLYQAPEGGETLDELTKRGHDFLAEIKLQYNDQDNVMIVAHGAMNKALLRAIKKSELKDFWAGKLQKNCGITIVELKADSYQIIEESKVVTK